MQHPSKYSFVKEGVVRWNKDTELSATIRFSGSKDHQDA
jgi:hypothetical protein